MLRIDSAPVSVNRRHGHWTRAHWATSLRLVKTQLAARELLIGLRELAPRPELPKRVRYEAHVQRSWDDDNLLAAMKPYRDGLVAGGLLHSDARDSGHVFEPPVEVIDPKWQGVLITVEPLVPIAHELPA